MISLQQQQQKTPFHISWKLHNKKKKKLAILNINKALDVKKAQQTKKYFLFQDQKYSLIANKRPANDQIQLYTVGKKENPKSSLQITQILQLKVIGQKSIVNSNLVR